MCVGGRFCFLFLWLSGGGWTKKALRAVVEFMLYKERQNAVLAYRWAADPEMGQMVCVLGCALRVAASGVLIGYGRMSWMEGSDCDDEDQHSWGFVCCEVEGQLGSVPVVVFV